MIEGNAGRSNIGALRSIDAASDNPNLSCVAVDGANHFDLLAPLNELIAREILKITGPPDPIADKAAFDRAFATR